MSSNTRTAAVVVVIVAFVAGILVGVAGDHFYLLRSGRMSGRRASGFSSAHMADRLRRELDLTAPQRTQVQAIIERHHEKIEATMNTVRPAVHQELEATNAEIDTVLTPDQRTKFAALRMRMDARRRDRNAGSSRGEQAPGH